MAKHRTYSIEFKRQVAQEFLAGESLHGLSRRHDVSRNLIRVWVAKLEAGTHQDLHTAAVVSHDGTVLGTESFSTTRAGYRAMLRWFRSHGELLRVGVESTGTYGAGITRHLALSGIPVLEVTGPDPASRRAKGKDDALDAISAAAAARTRRRVQVAKDRSGWRGRPWGPRRYAPRPPGLERKPHSMSSSLSLRSSVFTSTALQKFQRLLVSQ